MSIEALYSRWARFCGVQGCDDVVRVDAVWSMLTALYSRPVRAYHSLRHVAGCLDVMDSWRDDVDDVASVELALWVHDAVYEPRRSDNEAQSAVVGQMLAGELGIGDASVVHDLVIATCHGEGSLSGDAAVLVDIDLSTLGAEASAYDDYARAIRQEYSFVDEAEYRSGRAAVLRGFLKRDRIFRTERGHEQFEAPARGNLEREIAALEAGG